MPRSSTHVRQRGKNLFFLAVLLAFAGGLYYLAILKISGVH